MEESGYTEAMLQVAQAFEIVAAIILVLALFFSAFLCWRSWHRERDGAAAYRVMRQSFGGGILLGLFLALPAAFGYQVQYHQTNTEGLVVVRAVFSDN